MYVISCSECRRRHLVGWRAMVDLVDTDIGPVGRFRCPDGHHVLHAFRTRRSVAIAN